MDEASELLKTKRIEYVAKEEFEKCVENISNKLAVTYIALEAICRNLDELSSRLHQMDVEILSLRWR